MTTKSGTNCRVVVCSRRNPDTGETHDIFAAYWPEKDMFYKGISMPRMGNKSVSLTPSALKFWSAVFEPNPFLNDLIEALDRVDAEQVVRSKGWGEKKKKKTKKTVASSVAPEASNTDDAITALRAEMAEDRKTFMQALANIANAQTAPAAEKPKTKRKARAKTTGSKPVNRK